MLPLELDFLYGSSIQSNFYEIKVNLGDVLLGSESSGTENLVLWPIMAVKDTDFRHLC